MRNSITMKTRNIAVTTVLTLAALSVGTATAAAQPGTSNRATAPAGVTAVAHTGTHRTTDHAVAYTTAALPVPTGHGGVVAGVMGERNRPIAAGVDGACRARVSSVHHGTGVAGSLNNVDATTDFDNAVGNLANELGAGIPLGALVGTAIGGGVGCVAGAAVGAALMPPIFLPGAAGGCLAGLAAGAGIGAALGTVVVGVPVALAGGVKFYNSVYGPGAAHSS